MWTEEDLSEAIATEFKETQQWSEDDREKTEDRAMAQKKISDREAKRRYEKRHKAEIGARKNDREKARMKTDPEFRARRLRTKRESARRRRART